jgi:hypothetical protein
MSGNLTATDGLAVSLRADADAAAVGPVVRCAGAAS